MKMRAAALACLLTCFGLSLGAMAQAFRYQTLDVPNSLWTIPKGINARGHVVGATADDSGKHGFVWHAGKFSLIDVPNAVVTNAVGINARGDIVGRWSDSGGMNHGYLLVAGEFRTFDVPGCSNGTVPHGINNAGDIVGQCLDASGNMHGFLLSGSHVTFIDVPGALDTDAYKITDEGFTVGYYDTTDATAGGYVRSPSGTFTTFTVPGGINVGGRGINERMEIVGQFDTPSDGNTHGFLLHNLHYIQIDDPLSSGFTVASDINNRGTIVGDYLDAEGNDHGFIARPR